MLFGAFASGRLADRWFQSFSIPGYDAYEANQRTLQEFGNGAYPPLIAIFHSEGGDVTKERGIPAAVDAAVEVWPGSRVSSYFSTGSDAYVSDDRRTTFVEI